MKNNNVQWASIIANTLAHLGVKYAMIGAGSRSTPLTLAFSQHPEIKAISHVDERSAAFMGLGVAQYEMKPTVLISTSGTAAANFYPAIIEAKMSNIPMIVLTADRPPELRSSGANQTIDQVNLYGTHVNWFADVKVPPDLISDDDITYILNIVNQAYDEANSSNKGPVHLNLPFRKPLEPTPDQQQEIHPKLVMSSIKQLEKTTNEKNQGYLPTETQIESFKSSLEAARRPIFILGPKSQNEVQRNLLLQFCNSNSIPIFADAFSGLRFGPTSGMIIASYSTFLQNPKVRKSLEPDLIVHIGQFPIASEIEVAYREWRCEKISLGISNEIKDPTLSTKTKLQVSPQIILEKVLNHKELNIQIDQNWLSLLSNIENTTRETVIKFLKENPEFEPSYVQSILNKIQAGASLFVSSSLSVRHFDQFIFSHPYLIKIYANRGASGIDGTLSSALGMSLAHGEHSYLITGDLSLFHDMNGFLPMTRYGVKLLIILLNNSGGAIFNRLPISRFKETFREFFLTPHDIIFEKVCQAYSIDHMFYNEKDEILESGVCEIITDWTLIEEKRKELTEKISNLNSTVLNN